MVSETPPYFLAIHFFDQSHDESDRIGAGLDLLDIAQPIRQPFLIRVLRSITRSE
jgi:hypothetical protein